MEQNSLGVDHDLVRGLCLPVRNLLSLILKGGAMNHSESIESPVNRRKHVRRSGILRLKQDPYAVHYC